ncbi:MULTISPECIES: TetR/AcrR family transcriptional regulator [Amycolatopsis]|uniref:HTH tetR-type domain-containing protein n=1 Tax=Amycolatopsis thermalba TaxID=944492 RepID=A0ABY4P2W2_9PSEU|nr:MULTISPECIES: hypothetical protein [Amycolatopsis]OXM73743.1 hypothetical protein CF166_08655 [Amycolatopsis sp. KNN50.9b]UQS26644.1 hypothetical protein L1857_29500 [Amycolatopsis thermalba]
MSTPVRERAPITRSVVVTAALDLTRRRGLSGWTMRDLAAAVGARANVIRYHVGNRADVEAAVVAEVCAAISLPDGGAWADWIRLLAARMRETVARYPGVGRAVATGSGPAAPLLEAVVAELDRAGFAAESELAAHAVLVETCLSRGDGLEFLIAGLTARLTRLRREVSTGDRANHRGSGPWHG